IFGTMSSPTNTLTGANLVNVWTLSGLNAGTVASDTNSLTFTNFPNLAGGPNIDRLVGTNGNLTWNLTGSNSGNIPTLITSFTGMENLTGGTGDDSFV